MLFNKMKEPVFLKKDSDALRQLEQLKLFSAHTESTPPGIDEKDPYGQKKEFPWKAYAGQQF